MSARFLTAVLFGFLAAAASCAARLLTLSGSLATFILAVIIYGTGGWRWTVPIVTFFLLSSLLSRYGRSQKTMFDEVFEKSSTRDWGQVLANGGVAGLIAVLSGLFPLYDFYPLYLGSLAAVTADTWSTEIGVLGKGRTYSVVSFRPVEPGTSGGVSEYGSMGGAVGAAVVALSGYPWYTELRTTLVVVTAGIAGSLADSLLGATVQAQFKCVVCEKTTERKIHCGKTTKLARGIPWFGNDVVNGLCALAGALVVWGLLLLRL
ncbi:MAG: DUF92 domain-containing protein [Ignavibacteriales bacterium]|nr:DUF92 domain-containing protein [Ignavibacteriales bacterium]